MTLSPVRFSLQASLRHCLLPLILSPSFRLVVTQRSKSPLRAFAFGPRGLLSKALLAVGSWVWPFQLWIPSEMVYFEVTEMAFPFSDNRS